MTNRQAEVLTFIRSYQAAHNGASPSYREIGAAVGVKHASGVLRILNLLRTDGRVAWTQGRRRTLEIVGAGQVAA